MQELVTWVNDERNKAELHPLLIVGICVVVFLEIHPYFLLLYGVKDAPLFTKLLCLLGALFMMGSAFAAIAFDSITIGAIGFSLCAFWGVTFGLFWE